MQYKVCVLVSCYLCFCPAEGMYFIGAAPAMWPAVNSCALCLRLRCYPLLQWVITGLVLSGVGGCNAGMPGYAICPAAECLLVRHQPLLLKLHHQF